MPITNLPPGFKPEIWEKNLLEIIENTAVMPKLLDRYTANFKDAIFSQKYFAFKVDDVEAAQSDINVLSNYASRVGIAIRDVVDAHLIDYYKDVDPSNIIGTDDNPIVLTKDNIGGYLEQLLDRLTAAGAEGDNLHLIVTPKFKTMLLESGEFAPADSVVDNVVFNGYIGDARGFSVHVTTNNPAVNNMVNLLAFNTVDFIKFKSTVKHLEIVRPYNMYTDALKGVYLYASEVSCAEAGAVLKAVAF